MLVKMVCPQCGAPMEAGYAGDFFFCRYCGARIMNTTQKYSVTQNINVGGTVIHKFDNTGKPNLCINYSSKSQDVGMKVRIVSTNEKSFFVNGQSISFRLPCGEQKIVLKIGKINYNRTLYMPENNDLVTIYASWNGRAHIKIDQPAYTPAQNVAPQTPAFPAAQASSAVQTTVTKTCSSCGTPANMNAKFCVRCGAPFSADHAMRCPNCGKELTMTERFCMGCGLKNPFLL